jgi:NitT/TauT family transport system substrate-binding protein
MWPALAKANGIDPKSVTWVNIDANAKLSALKSKAIDVTTSFYNIHHIFQKELGADMGFLAWREVGLNPYGNSVIVNASSWRRTSRSIDKFVKVSQRAFAACVKEARPCVQALIDANGALNYDSEMVNWQLVEVLMSDKYSQSVALGHPRRRAHEGRLRAGARLRRHRQAPFDVKTTYTNEFLDPLDKDAEVDSRLGCHPRAARGAIALTQLRDPAGQKINDASRGISPPGRAPCA